MSSLATVLDWLSVALLAVGTTLLLLTRKGLETAVAKSAEEAVTRGNWPRALARELEKVRGTERQVARLRSYEKLWSAMRTMAIYEESPFDRETARSLSKNLSDWYFSEDGGLMLTPSVRELYFALQDLLRTIGSTDSDWQASRIVSPKTIFKNLLEEQELNGAARFLERASSPTSDWWTEEDIAVALRSWRADIGKLSAEWGPLTSGQKFATVQQVSSVLRTGLTADVDSRLR